MKIISNLKIGLRLTAGFGLVLLLLCTVAGIGLLEATRIYEGTNQLGENWLPSVESLGSMRSHADDARRWTLREMSAIDPAAAHEARQQHS